MVQGHLDATKTHEAIGDPYQPRFMEKLSVSSFLIFSWHVPICNLIINLYIKETQVSCLWFSSLDG